MAPSTTAFPSAPGPTPGIRGGDVGGMQLPGGRSSWTAPYGTASPASGDRRARYPYIKDLQDQAARLEVDERSPVMTPLAMRTSNRSGANTNRSTIFSRLRPKPYKNVNHSLIKETLERPTSNTFAHLKLS
jgi:hypothetical protein